MSPEQIQDIVMGTLHAAMDTGDIVSSERFTGMMGNRDIMPENEPQEPENEPTEFNPSTNA
jgi:hypothetical protein